VPKTLIVPLDGSTAAERAVTVATRLAGRLESCDLVLVSADVQAADRHADYIHALAHDLTATVSVRGESHAGDAAGVIARLVEREPDAAVCMTTRGRGRVAGPLLGSTATDVLRLVDVPVLLVGPHCHDDWWHQPPRLVACWAGNDSDPVLAPAITWSNALGMDVSLVCVFHPLDVPATVDPASEFTAALRQLDAAHQDIPTVALHEELPAAAIAEYTRTLPASLIALTTRARNGVGRAVLGSVALDVVHQSACPVLAVRTP
jgi:nucleotide-binding universal stress UspA family protein